MLYRQIYSFIAILLSIYMNINKARQIIEKPTNRYLVRKIERQKGNKFEKYKDR